MDSANGTVQKGPRSVFLDFDNWRFMVCPGCGLQRLDKGLEVDGGFDPC